MSEAQIVTFSAPKAREIGMLMATLGAERADPGWNERAYLMLQCFLSQARDEFLAEEAREWAVRNGLTEPKNKRAWGPVINRAAREGLIVFKGYAKTTNPLAHQTPASLWVKKP